MNCEKYQIVLGDFVDGLVTGDDLQQIEAHVQDCIVCAEVRDDFVAIVGFCKDQRGEYDAVPNERALWLRISNIIEAEASVARPSGDVPSGAGWWFRLANRSWRLSFPQLAASAAVLVLVVSVATVFIGRMTGLNQPNVQSSGVGFGSSNLVSLDDRYRQQQQAIAYWNQRVELNKARWNPQMRETFDRNMSVIDAAVADSMTRLRQDPHDTVSEDILNDALNDKVALLKEFSNL